jgi:hypothetical protein
MSRLGSTGRFHVGFAERGLKDWAKKPANTSQKRGDGVFEAQCAARIRERSMIDHALSQMDSDEDDRMVDDNEINDKNNVGGTTFYIKIERDPGNTRRKKVTSTRINDRKKAHRDQIAIPATIIHHFKSIGLFDEVYEMRTEAMIQGTRYRAHPNFRGEGPWYDFANVEFQPENDLDNQSIINNNNDRYPAKLLGFYRLHLPPGEDENEFLVLTHRVQYQMPDLEIGARQSLLQHSWLYEVTNGRGRDSWVCQEQHLCQRSNLCH